jgi:tetratricopeptide (TPR) repeat protein
MRLNINEKSILLSDKGMECCYNGDLKKGLKYFDEGLKEDPDNILLLYNKAGCLVGLGEMDESKRLFEKIIRLCDGKAQTEVVMNIKANSYTYMGDFESARKVFEEILRYFPENVDALLSRGICFEKKFEFDKAMACFDKVLSLDPDNFEANIHKCELCLDLGKKEESKQYIDKLSEMAPDFHYVLYLKGYYHCVVTEDYEKALSYYKRATNLIPDFEKCYFDMGKIYILLGNAEGAKRCFRKVSSFKNDEKSEKMLEGITDIFSGHYRSD